jgi:signal transduction histidine kinase
VRARLVAINPWFLDSALAAALAVAAVTDWGYSHDPLWRLPLQLLIAASVVARRRAPVVAMALAVGAALLLRVSPGAEGYSAFLINAYSVGRHSAARWRSLALVLLISAVAASAGSDVSTVLVALIAWLVGDLRRERALGAAAAVEAAQRGAAEERSRIARELHDVIAHGVAVMVVQAEAARNQLDRDPERAREAIETISAAGREAMIELRQLLEVLGHDEAAASSVAPTPSVKEIDALVERVRAAGHPVALRVDGDPARVSPSAGLAAFRIVQEGLTNAIKHAPGAAIEVRIVFGKEVEVEVLDSGTTPANRAPRTAGAGRGLAGLSERIRLLGGRLTAGPTDFGGYALKATIPLEPAGP